MPSSTICTIEKHYTAGETIPASAFIPRYLGDKGEMVRGHDESVGVRGFNCNQYDTFSPFLTLSDITVNPPLLFPDHPHCGHDMVMYVLEGEFTHEDFMGWTQTFGAGDTHWMRYKCFLSLY